MANVRTDPRQRKGSQKRSGLTPARELVLRAFLKLRQEYGYSPTYRELAKATGRRGLPGSHRDTLLVLVREGYLRYAGKELQARALVPTKLAAKYQPARPLHGTFHPEHRCWHHELAYFGDTCPECVRAQERAS